MNLFGRRAVVMQGEGSGSGGGGDQFNVAEAKSFLTNFVPDPKALDALPEPDLKAYHGRVKGFVDTSASKAAEEAKKNAGFPESWREQLAGKEDKDNKRLERLKRYQTPQALADALLGVQDRIAAGELRSALPPSGDAAAVAEWRKQHGIPAKPEDYKVELEEGRKVDGVIQPEGLKEFLAVAHEEGVAPKTVNKVLGWFVKRAEAQKVAMDTRDAQVKQTAEDELRKVWGQDYRRNVNAIHGLLDTAPAEVKEMILNARTPEGVPFASHPGILQFLAAKSLELNPHITVVPGEHANVASAIEDEIKALEKQMGDLKSDYWKDEKKQARYRQLVEARAAGQRKAA